MVASVPRVDQPDLLDRADPIDHLDGQLDLALRRRAERQPATGRRSHGLDDRGMGVPEDHRSPRRDAVDVLVPVRVGQVRTAAR